jgi:maleamate amidohydrolase
VRVWDKFLSERDKEHANLYWGKKQPFGLGGRPALLVIDNIYGILGPRASLMDIAGALPTSCGLEGWEAIDRTVELIAAARANHIPIAYARLRDEYPEGVMGGKPKRFQTDASKLPSIVVDRYGDIVDEIAPRPEDFVISKTSASMFAGTELGYFLTDIQADTVICCGNSTSGCVRATVVDAGAHRYKVGLVEECTFDRTEASHAMSLFDMETKYCDVMSLANTVAYFEGLKGVMRIAA